MDVLNSVCEGKIDVYLKERMQTALANNESAVNTGVISYCNEFAGIFDEWKDYPLSKSRLLGLVPGLTPA